MAFGKKATRKKAAAKAKEQLQAPPQPPPPPWVSKHVDSPTVAALSDEELRRLPRLSLRDIMADGKNGLGDDFDSQERYSILTEELLSKKRYQEHRVLRRVIGSDPAEYSYLVAGVGLEDRT